MNIEPTVGHNSALDHYASIIRPRKPLLFDSGCEISCIILECKRTL